MSPDNSEPDAPVEPDHGLPVLTFAESRVLGCLLEKEATTPQSYPLTLNALHSACNQASNRNPVTDLGTDEVEEAAEGLRYKNLALLVHQAGARVAKIRHTLDAEFPYLPPSQTALICVLLLRGQQTAGELRQRTERMHPFSDLEAVERQLVELINNQPAPLVKRIPAGGGKRVETFVHLLCGDVAVEEAAMVQPSAAAAVGEKAPPGRIEELETEVSELRSTVRELEAEVQSIKRELGLG